MQTKLPKQFKDEIVFGFTSGHQGFTYSDIDRTLPVDPGSKIHGEHYGFLQSKLLTANQPNIRGKPAIKLNAQ